MSEVDAALADLETKLTTGDLGTDSIFVELQHTQTITVDILTGAITSAPCLLLQMVAVPVRLRRQGVARRILDLAERRADALGVVLVVGPIMEDENGNAYLGDMCRRRGYAPTPPWSYVRKGQCQIDTRAK